MDNNTKREKNREFRLQSIGANWERLDRILKIHGVTVYLTDASIDDLSEKLAAAVEYLEEA